MTKKRKARKSHKQYGRWGWKCPLCESVEPATRGEVLQGGKMRAHQRRHGTIPDWWFCRGCIDCATLTGAFVPRTLTRYDRESLVAQNTGDQNTWDGFPLRDELHRLCQLPIIPMEVRQRPPSLILKFTPTSPKRQLAVINFDINTITMAVWPGLSASLAASTMIHELAHAVAGPKAHHGPAFKRTFMSLLLEGYRFVPTGFNSMRELDGLAQRCMQAFLNQQTHTQPELQPEPETTETP